MYCIWVKPQYAKLFDKCSGDRLVYLSFSGKNPTYSYYIQSPVVPGIGFFAGGKVLHKLVSC